MNLYPFQLDVNRAVWRAYQQGAKSVLLQAPTGSGKTLMGSHLIAMRREHKRERAIVFAHRREIVQQTAAKLEQAGLIPQIIMAGHCPNPWANVDVASIDTVWARHKRGESFPEADFLVIDECHGAGQKRYQEIVKHYQSKGAILLGLTATPMRSDGYGLGRMFEKMERAPDVPWLMEHGYLSPVQYRVGIVPDASGIKIVAGDYNQAQAEAVMDQRMLIGDVVENWLHHARDRKTMLFAAGVKHSIHLVDEFQKAGINAVHVDGNTEKDVRDKVFEGSKSGEVQIVCNAQVYVEGTDFPWIDCIVGAKLTKSLVRYLQMGGRGLRAYPGKSDLLYLDHANNVWEHGRLETPRDWELTEGKEQVDKLAAQRKQSEKMQIRCHVCGFLLTRAVCSQCGTPMLVEGKAQAFLPGMLVEMTQGDFEKATRPKVEKPKEREYTMAEKQAFYSGLLWLCQERGKHLGMAAHRYRDKFGCWPNGLSKDPKPPSWEVEKWDRHQRIKWAKAQKKEAPHAPPLAEVNG